MLRRTFCHTPGISKESEEALWKNNILDWDSFLSNEERIDFLGPSKTRKLKEEILISKSNLENNNLNYFRDKLNPRDHYRLVNHGKVCFLDIETTGLSKYVDELTVLGIYDGKETFIYVKNNNMEEAVEHLKKYDIIVTFNGKRFDLPFIEHKFKTSLNVVHLDLMYMLKEFGLKGGLKNIEKELGICRAEEVENVDGFEAVRLWNRYLKGDRKALGKLIKYNEEDIVNLKYLLDYYIKQKAEKKRLLFSDKNECKTIEEIYTTLRNHLTIE